MPRCPWPAVAAPRVHHQWLPDRISMERFGFSADTWLDITGLSITFTPVANRYYEFDATALFTAIADDHVGTDRGRPQVFADHVRAVGEDRVCSVAEIGRAHV